MYIGLDTSTFCTGAAILSFNGEMIGCGTAEAPRSTRKLLERIQLILLELDALYDANGVRNLVDSVAIEKPFRGESMWMAFGNIAMQARTWGGCEVLGIPVPTVKKFARCKSGTKEEMSARVKARWGFTHQSHDVVDAYVLAHMARCWGGVYGYTKDEQEACKKAKVY